MKITQFIESIKGLSPQTQSAYRQTLYQLDQTVKGDEPTADEIKSFLEGYGNTPSTLQRHKAAIYRYWDWRFEDKKWPFHKDQFRKVHRRLPDFEYLSEDVVIKIARAGTKDDYWFVWTLFSLGCRIAEFMGIRDEDIREQGVMVLSKGGEYRLKVATPEFIAQLRKYIGRKKGRIFPNNYSYYYGRLKKLGAKVGYPNIHPHLLRHAKATDLLDKGLDGVYVQQFLGHASYSTTAIYQQVRPGKLHQELQKVEKANGNQNHQ
jgi:integrase/recombinase XerC